MGVIVGKKIPRSQSKPKGFLEFFTDLFKPNKHSSFKCLFGMFFIVTGIILICIVSYFMVSYDPILESIRRRKIATWAVVERNPDYIALSKKEKAIAKREYFEVIIAPHLNEGKLSEAENVFLQTSHYKSYIEIPDTYVNFLGSGIILVFIGIGMIVLSDPKKKALIGQALEGVQGIRWHRLSTRDRVKLVLVIGLVLVFLSCIYVPWEYLSSDSYYIDYNFIWAPRGHASIVYGRIALEIIAIAAATAIAALLVTWRRKNNREDPEMRQKDRRMS